MQQLTLRNYQASTYKDAFKHLLNKKNVLIQIPTGGGKTPLGVKIIQDMVSAGIACWFIAHRKSLIQQTSQTLDRFGVQHGVVCAGYAEHLHRLVQVCSIDTLRARDYVQPSAAPRGADKINHIILWDECHHIAAKSWSSVYARYNARHIGLSATPNRLDGVGLGQFFDEIVTLDNVIQDQIDTGYKKSSVSWLIDQGFLAEYKLYTIPGVDMSGVKKTAGEYHKGDTVAEMQKREIVGNIIENYKTKARGLKAIGFAVTIDHAESMAKEFNEAGISSAHLSSKSPKDDQFIVLRQFAEGIIDVLWNVDLFSEGFDISANSGMDVVVRCVIDCAPTTSLAKWLQRCGRALRPSAGAVILDNAGNAYRDGRMIHGLPCEPRRWTLTGTLQDEKVVQLKQCERCFYMHKPAPKCPECGYVYPKKPDNSRDVSERDDRELMEMDPTAVAAMRQERERAKKLQVAKCKNLKQLKLMGYSSAQAKGILSANARRLQLIKEIQALYMTASSIGISIEQPDIDMMMLDAPAQIQAKKDQLMEVIRG